MVTRAFSQHDMRGALLKVARRCTTRLGRHHSTVPGTLLPAVDGKYRVKTYNAIAPEGLAVFPKELYTVGPDVERPHAILLRSHKLRVDQVDPETRAIARCGAGVNNVPVKEMTEYGIPVFNSPGANANAVKELVICSLFLASRGIVDGIAHTAKMFEDESDFGVVKKRVEAERKHFKGQEIRGKTLGVVGLGAIGASVAEAAQMLGMDIVAFDPAISIEQAWRLSGKTITRMNTVADVLAASDYITLHVPYMDATHHLLGQQELAVLKPNACILNFARGPYRTLHEDGALTAMCHR